MVSLDDRNAIPLSYFAGEKQVVEQAELQIFVYVLSVEHPEWRGSVCQLFEDKISDALETVFQLFLVSFD